MNLTKTRNTTKYLAIKELSDENKTYSISALCEFAGIARSAYYKWLDHVNSDNDNLNERIADTITKIHDEHPDIEKYIDYYTNKRVQRNLGVLTPLEFHEQKLENVA